MGPLRGLIRKVSVKHPAGAYFTSAQFRIRCFRLIRKNSVDYLLGRLPGSTIISQLLSMMLAMAQPIRLLTSYPLDECRQRLHRALSARVTTKLWGITISDHRYIYGNVTGNNFTFHFPSRFTVYLNGTLTSAPEGTLIQVRVRFPHEITALTVFMFVLGGFFMLGGRSATDILISLFLFGFGLIWGLGAMYVYRLYRPRLVQHLQRILKAAISNRTIEGTNRERSSTAG